MTVRLRHQILVLPPVLLTLLCLPAGADPTGSVEGGGTISLLAEHPTISLNQERLTFTPCVDGTRVTAVLDFENHGEAVAVPMGFPIPMWHPGSGQDFVKAFTVTVDSKPLEVTGRAADSRLVLQGRPAACRWYEFTVPFAAKAKLQMGVKYAVEGGSLQVSYILATGGTWRGSIRDFELRVPLGERLNYHHVSLTGDHTPLAHELRDGTMVWRCADYNGTPEVLWFRAERGPAKVTVDGTDPRAFGYRPLTGDVTLDGSQRPFVWHKGVLLTESGFLSRLLMTQPIRDMVSVDGDGRRRIAHIQKEGARCDAPGSGLAQPSLEEGKEPYGWYLDARPALAAYGGKIEHRINDQGDLEVAATSLPQDVESARATALCKDQHMAYRLRCLRYLKQQAPATMAEVARGVGARELEDPLVLMGLVGYAAEETPAFLTAEVALPRLRLPAGRDRIEMVISLASGVDDDCVVRGAGLVLARIGPQVAREQILQRVTQSGSRPRSYGLLLRVIGLPDTCRCLIEAPETRPVGHGTIMTLGYLGSDEAVPFLAATAREHTQRNDGIADDAAIALGLIGTQTALETCAALAQEQLPIKRFTAHCLQGLARAVTDQPRQPWYYPSPPAWARPLSRAQASAIVLPLASRLKHSLPAGYGSDLDAIIAAAAGPGGPG